MNCTIYALKLENGRIFYIGRTRYYLKHRLKGHSRNENFNATGYTIQWMLELGIDFSITPIVSGLDYDRSVVYERKIIERISSRQPLINEVFNVVYNKYHPCYKKIDDKIEYNKSQILELLKQSKQQNKK